MGDRTDFDHIVVPDKVVLELPDHGEELQQAETWDQTVGHMLEKLPDGSHHLIGYSMGGRIAAAMAYRSPDRIARLTLIGANLGIDDELRSERRALDAGRAVALRRDPDAFLERWRELALFGPQTSAAWQRYQDRQRHPARWANALNVLTVANQPDLRTSLPPVEITFIVGSNDEKYRNLAKTWGVESIEVPEAWHAVHRDQPEAVTTAISS